MKKYIQIGAALGALSVGIGAFGAHGLEKFLVTNDNADTFETASKYLFYHALALILLGLMPANKWTKRSAVAFQIGILIFSGSLYLICFTLIKTFGATAPFGGLSLIAGWICMFLGARFEK
jgi:uncharacterized membrane protein YgdD (TMEM256/DUF423 family)